MEKPFPVERVGSALLAIQAKISQPQMSMLRAHYLYRTLSMRRIALFGGYLHPQDGNFQYGGLAGRIARQLGFETPGQQPERDSAGEWQWRMDDVVVKGLDKTGWFSQIADEKPEPMQLSEVPKTEREMLIKARVGQGNFRTDVIALWGCCAVTGCSLSRILIASHIVP